MIQGLPWRKFAGPSEVSECLGDPALLAVRLAEVVPCDRVCRREFERLFPLRHRLVDLIDIAKKTAVRQPRTNMARVPVEKSLVRLTDLAKPLAHLQVERRRIDADLFRGQLRIVSNPFVDFIVNLVIQLEQLAELTLDHRIGRVSLLDLLSRRLAWHDQQRCKKNVPDR